MVFVPIQWLWQHSNHGSWVQQALEKQAGYLESSVPWLNLEVDRIPWIERKLDKNWKIDSQKQNRRMKNEKHLPSQMKMIMIATKVSVLILWSSLQYTVSLEFSDHFHLHFYFMFICISLFICICIWFPFSSSLAFPDYFRLLLYFHVHLHRYFHWYFQFHSLIIFNLICCSQSSIALKDDAILNVIRGALFHMGSFPIVILKTIVHQW
jgi:hypothetical protein